MYGTKLNRAWLLIFSILLIASQRAFAQAGQLDPTFGNGGIVTTDFGDQRGQSNVASANAVVIQPNGQILVCGGIPGSNDSPSLRWLATTLTAALTQVLELPASCPYRALKTFHSPQSLCRVMARL